MSHTYNALTSTENKDFKIHSREYLPHIDEPGAKGQYDGALAELNTNLIRNSYLQKRKLRRVARKLRHAYYS
jgi:hypothetical protein